MNGLQNTHLNCIVFVLLEFISLAFSSIRQRISKEYPKINNKHLI